MVDVVVVGGVIDIAVVMAASPTSLKVTQVTVDVVYFGFATDRVWWVLSYDVPRVDQARDVA